MANNPIPILQIRQILRLHSTGTSKQKISKYLGLSRNIVKKYINMAQRYKLSYENISKLEIEEIQELFYT